ncbi:MAG: PBP1A family penicillin-binding protein [Chthoniobacterales bacterium]
MPVSYRARDKYLVEYPEPPWYTKPKFYLPLGAFLALIIGGFIYLLIMMSDLRSQAETYDLTQLEQMESASVIADRNDKIFGQIYVENRETIPYDQMPRDLINAVVAMEDNKFYQHSGYDFFGIVRAALKNFTAGHVRQGASTITQQLARNTFSLKERTFRRKLVELFLARRIEERLGKQKIMELYLNRIYFGGGLYGAEAAARGYFGKPAREMSLAESATIAGVIKSPNRISPWSDKQAAKENRNLALTRMRDLGFISPEKCAAAQAEEVSVVGTRQNAQGQTYAIEYIRQQVIAAVGWDRAMNEGFRIRTTIDADLQKVAEDSLRTHLDKVEQTPGYSHETYEAYATRFNAAKKAGQINRNAAPEYLQGAVIALDNQTGGILALVGGRDFEHNQYDRALQAHRPAGTAFTPFVFAAAFEKGLYPGTIVEDSALDNRAVMIGGTTGILGEWGPENPDNRYEGPITARQALAKGKNGATVRIGMQAGLDAVMQLCKSDGIKSALRPFPATFLGSSEVTLAELALAYTVFPNNGSPSPEPFVLERIEEKNGGIVWQSERDKTRHSVMKPETAYEVHSCLVDALDKGTGAAARKNFGLGQFPAAGKTGTAYDFTEALFVGYDNAITCAVRAGFDKPQKIYRGAFGREIALPVWVDIMNASTTRYAPKELAKPAGVQSVEICAKSGLLATDKCGEFAYRELATKEQMPTDPCNVHGDARTRIAHDLPDAGVPRAALAVDTAQVKAVPLQAPTVLAENDPYSAVKSTVKPPRPPDAGDGEVKAALPVTKEDKQQAQASATPAPVPTAAPAEETPVLRAQPVTPQDRETPIRETPIPRAAPVAPERTVIPRAEPVLRAQPVNPRDLRDPRLATPRPRATPDEEESGD